MGERNDYSEDLINYLKSFEDFRDKAYQLEYKDKNGNIVKETWEDDGSPKYTIGWGLTRYSNGKKVGPNDVITEELADKAMRDYLSSKYDAIKYRLPNWELMPLHTKDGIYSMVYRAGSLKKSPRFSENLNNAFADGVMTKDEYLQVLREMDFTHSGNLLDRALRNAALLGGLYNYADNSSINYATTHTSPYENLNTLMKLHGSTWSKRWKDVTGNSNQNRGNFAPQTKLTSFFKPLKAQSNLQFYTIQSGDVLSVIANKYSITMDDILKLNPQIKNPDAIYAGLLIKLPVVNKHKQGGKLNYLNYFN